MKIAYCISGHVREFQNKLSQPSVYFSELKSDLFLSTWTRSGIDCSFWKGDLEDGVLIDSDILNVNYNPKFFDIEDISKYNYLSSFDRVLPNSPHSVNMMNTLLMFKKIKQCISYTNIFYDVVFRSRFDLNYISIDMNKEIQTGKIYGKRSPINGFPSDIFFYGDYETMIRCVPDESFYTEDLITDAINAEDIFDKYLKFNGIDFIIDNELSYNLKGMTY